jgi:hypothetical protein
MRRDQQRTTEEKCATEQPDCYPKPLHQVPDLNKTLT